ncbi:hypothetical protein SAMN02799615_03080 [Dyella marensis]|jgi:hypothetical protein|uniref:Uncharacterized protein n=1 Tax=Dyella marensis TaxID=500610 RepID=A0A1I2HN55_9GAMM|nr:hypothetical protein SAMN02799615_03080 [Dyella marensis]
MIKKISKEEASKIVGGIRACQSSDPNANRKCENENRREMAKTPQPH